MRRIHDRYVHGPRNGHKREQQMEVIQPPRDDTKHAVKIQALMQIAELIMKG